jgi:AraC family transcriptional regulator
MDWPHATPWIILHERARQHHWQGAGWLSIKTFRNGSAHYAINRARYDVSDDSYLVLNRGQEYRIDIEQRAPIESFCLFFAPGFIEQILISRQNNLSEAPAPTRDTFQFFERTHGHDAILSPALRRLQQNWKRADPGWIEEQIHFIAEKLLETHHQNLKQANQLTNVRAATREELYRRVWRARDYSEAMFAEKVRLADLAKVAALSPNHLLRTFKDAFHETPHQFLTRRRVQEAARLLHSTELSVTEICMTVGFESLGSFSKLFKDRTGLAPIAFRNAKK